MNNALFEKLWKMWENIEILNLPQQKVEIAVSIRTKLSYNKVFHRKPISNRNGRNRDTYE